MLQKKKPLTKSLSKRKEKIGWLAKILGSEYRIVKVTKGLKPGRVVVFSHTIYIREED